MTEDAAMPPHFISIFVIVISVIDRSFKFMADGSIPILSQVLKLQFRQ